MPRRRATPRRDAGARAPPRPPHGRGRTCGRRGDDDQLRPRTTSPSRRHTPRGLMGSASLQRRSVGWDTEESRASRLGRSVRIHDAASGYSCAYSDRQSSGANGVMSIPAEVAVSTSRRTHAGRARRAIRATTPPIDCATRSTGPGPARSRTRRARSARLATSGREGTRSRATSCWRLATGSGSRLPGRHGRGCARGTWFAGRRYFGRLPGDPDLAENRDQTLDAQGLRGHKPGRAYTLLDGGSNELRRVVAHSFTFEIRAIATAA